MAIGGDQDVLRLQVTVKDVVFVEMLDCQDDLADVVLRLLLREAASSLAQDPRKISASAVLENDKELLLILKRLPHFDNKRMPVHLFQNSLLRFSEFQEVLIVNRLLILNLHSVLLARGQVDAEEHLPEGALPNEVYQLVVLNNFHVIRRLSRYC